MSPRVLMLVVIAWFTAASIFITFWLRAKSVLLHRRVTNPVFASDPALRRYYGKLGLSCEIGFYFSVLVSLALGSWFIFELFGLTAALVIVGIVVTTGLLIWILVTL